MHYVKNSSGVRVGKSCRRISFHIDYLDEIVGVEIKAFAEYQE